VAVWSGRHVRGQQAREEKEFATFRVVRLFHNIEGELKKYNKRRSRVPLSSPVLGVRLMTALQRPRVLQVHSTIHATDKARATASSEAVPPTTQEQKQKHCVSVRVVW